MSAPPPSRGRMFYYESVAGEWDRWMGRHELRKRLRLIFGKYLSPGAIRGKRVLDAGCGTGHFSRELAQRGARLVSVDLGPGLLGETLNKCQTRAAAASLLGLPFLSSSFDLVLCTEVIEHTPDPRAAVSELCRVLAPGGSLLVTVPNKLWHPLVVAANRLGLRRYAGFENWVGYAELADWLRGAGLRLEKQEGFNLLPHPFFCREAFDFLDKPRAIHPFMINIAALARKPV